MSIFDDVRLSWAGKPYLIPAHRVLGAIARIEEVVTLQELSAYAARGTAPMAIIAKAYAAVLEYAGASVTAEEVYAGMFDPAAGGEVGAAVSGLLGMMIPPKRLQETGTARGNVPRPGKAGQRSRKKPSS